MTKTDTTAAGIDVDDLPNLPAAETRVLDRYLTVSWGRMQSIFKRGTVTLDQWLAYRKRRRVAPDRRLPDRLVR